MTVVSSDMREWVAPEKADIIVSELLGSFADNELSPECLDGAQHFLKGLSRSGGRRLVGLGSSLGNRIRSYGHKLLLARLENDIQYQSFRELKVGGTKDSLPEVCGP